ncbi:O-antigen ligase family protein [Sphingopyxis sp.]|uniref:O-antigen ligase family protein n=1 Tax=Sphingopyxis sp. TaxID=1908224 RepID=UPI003D80C594
MGFVFLLGGGSRSDIASLPVLRAVALLVAVWAALSLAATDWRRIRVPLVLLAALTLWMAVQLVPLPPAMWQGLPARDGIAAIDDLLGQADLWRAISLTPTLTWNALLGMTVPFAALFLAARIAPDDYPRLMLAIVAIAGFSVLLGVIQVLMGHGSLAYLYRITNSGTMVGLFANRNHHAVFIACAVLCAGMLLRDELMRKRRRNPVRVALAAAIALLTAFTALIGSRAGLVAGAGAFALSYAMIIAAWHTRTERSDGGRRATPTLWQRLLVYSPPVLMLAVMATMILLSDRETAVNRLADQAFVDDLRIQAWPTVQLMMEKFWLLGSGFGSFPATYEIFEPDALLQTSYFNHAHNDWAELVITGGLPFALIALAALAWMGRAILARGLRNLVKGFRGDIRLPVIAALAILALASAVDYPLRVPSLQLLAITLTILLCCPWSTRGERE